MNIINSKCPNCNYNHELDDKEEFIECEQCGFTFIICQNCDQLRCDDCDCGNRFRYPIDE